MFLRVGVPRATVAALSLTRSPGHLEVVHLQPTSPGSDGAGLATARGKYLDSLQLGVRGPGPWASVCADTIPKGLGGFWWLRCFFRVKARLPHGRWSLPWRQEADLLEL